jgi:hypothetical protein
MRSFSQEFSEWRILRAGNIESWKVGFRKRLKQASILSRLRPFLRQCTEQSNGVRAEVIGLACQLADSFHITAWFSSRQNFGCAHSATSGQFVPSAVRRLV